MSFETLATEPFWVQEGNIFAVPILHYKMEFAAQVRQAFLKLQPDCVAVELAETMQLQLLHAASRLPDLSVAITYDKIQTPVFYLCEPCDPCFEGLRSALESGIPSFCIDLDVDYYPSFHDPLPDPYAVSRIGLKEYYKVFCAASKEAPVSTEDLQRETHMAKRLKELSLRYDKVLFVGGMAHIQRVLKLLQNSSFEPQTPAIREVVELCTLTEESARDVMAETGFVTLAYENWRAEMNAQPDRMPIIFNLFKQAGERYTVKEKVPFPAYHLRNLIKFSRNYALITGQLMPDLYQVLSSAKACVDHNYGYHTWVTATDYPYLKNVDNLAELHLTIEQVWGHSKLLRFHLRHASRKSSYQDWHRKDSKKYRFEHGLFGICSYPREDAIIEKFGDFLKKKGRQILLEESSRTIPFTSSIEDGIDTRETIRHWHERKLYVRTKGKPPSQVGSVVVIFDEDAPDEGLPYVEKYPWALTWIGEHAQESDMAFFATPMGREIIGPGICRCEYGGFMMSYPPRRMRDVWSDPDYSECRNKAEVLLMAAIDYAVQPLIVYAAAKPPRSQLKSFAKRFGKKIIYVPLGQLSPVLLNKLRVFHVLDGHDKRRNASDYIR